MLGLTYAVLAMGQTVAHHDVVLHDQQVAVTTTWSDDAVVDAEGRIVLALPLPPSITVTGATTETAVDGEVIALVLAQPHAARPHVEVLAALDAEALPLPIAIGSQTQRVRIGDTLRFLPDARLGLVAHLGQTMPATWGRGDRAAVDARLPGERSRLGAIYLPTDAAVRAGGVIGVVEPREVGRQRTALGIGVVFVVICGAAVWAYRRARASVEAEQAELLLAAEFDALARDDGAPS